MSEPLFTEDFLLRLERLSLAARRAIAGQTQGERRSVRRGQSVEFADFRPYVAGDDFRRIDWNAYARMERFFIKLFVEEEDVSVHFLLDGSASMRWGEPEKLTYAVKAAAALGYIALCGLDRVSVTALNQPVDHGNNYFPFHRGKKQAAAFFAFLQNLLVYKPQEQWLSDPARDLRTFAGGNSAGILFLLSDLMDDGWKDGLSTLAGRGFEISVLHILSPDEVHPEIEGDVKLIDSETGTAVEVTADYELLQQYHRHLTDWQAELLKFCSSRAIHYIPVETVMPLDELLFAWMRRKGALK